MKTDQPTTLKTRFLALCVKHIRKRYF